MAEVLGNCRIGVRHPAIPTPRMGGTGTAILQCDRTPVCTAVKHDYVPGWRGNQSDRPWASQPTLPSRFDASAGRSVSPHHGCPLSWGCARRGTSLGCCRCEVPATAYQYSVSCCRLLPLLFQQYSSLWIARPLLGTCVGCLPLRTVHGKHRADHLTPPCAVIEQAGTARDTVWRKGLGSRAKAGYTGVSRLCIYQERRRAVYPAY